MHCPGTVQLDNATEVDEKDERNDEGAVRKDEVGYLRVLCFYRPWDGLYSTRGITWLGGPLSSVVGPRLLWPLVIGEGHEEDCMVQPSGYLARLLTGARAGGRQRAKAACTRARMEKAKRRAAVRMRAAALRGCVCGCWCKATQGPVGLLSAHCQWKTAGS